MDIKAKGGGFESNREEEQKKEELERKKQYKKDDLKKLDLEIEEKNKDQIEYQIKREVRDLFDKEDRIDIDERTVEIPMNGGHLKVIILGKNKFKINNGSEVIYPTTIGGNNPWYTSEWYRNKIKNTLIETCDLSKKESIKIVNIMCKNVGEKIRELIATGDMLIENEELQDILCEITKVTVIRSEDANIYQIHLQEKIIQLTDKEVYDGPRAFCIQYLNRFLQKIIISNEEWDNIFIPNILSEDKLVPEADTVDSNVCVVTEKFLQYIQNKKIYNWNDTDKRKGYRIAIFYDNEKHIVMIFTDFITRFFENEKITLSYKINTIGWASYLHAKNFLVDKRQHGRIGDKIKTFWVFDPDKVMISHTDIEKDQKEETHNDSNITSIDEYSGDNNVL